MQINPMLRWAGETLLFKNPLLSQQEVEQRKRDVKNYLLNIYIADDHLFRIHYEPQDFILLTLEFLTEENEVFFEEVFFEAIEGLEHFAKYVDRNLAYQFVLMCIKKSLKENIKLYYAYQSYIQKVHIISSAFLCGTPIEISQKVAINAVVYGLDNFEDPILKNGTCLN